MREKRTVLKFGLTSVDLKYNRNTWNAYSYRHDRVIWYIFILAGVFVCVFHVIHPNRALMQFSIVPVAIWHLC